MELKMKYGELPGLDQPLSRIIQGSTVIRSEKDYHILDACLAAGINAVDTARVYNNDGRIAKWIHQAGVRKQWLVMTKGAHHAQDANGNLIERCTPQGISDDIAWSLDQYQTHIDIYVLHRDSPSVPVGEIVDCLTDHVRQGHIRAFGGSNWTHQRVAAAHEYATQHGKIPFAFANPNFGLAEMYNEPWLHCLSIAGPQGEAGRRWYRERNHPVFSWSTLGGGFWTGLYTRENQERMRKVSELVVRCYCGDTNYRRLARVMELAAAKGVTVPRIAVAWTYSQGLNLFGLIAARSAAEIADNVAGLHLELTTAELEWLDLRRDERV